MDITELPLDIQRHIQSFLFIVSWRAELHYFRLWHFLKTRTFDNLPESMKCLQEEKRGYVYSPYQGESIIIPFRDTMKIAVTKSIIVQRYTTPLHSYLTTYRWNNVSLSWSLTSKFQLFGVHVYGTMDSSMYRFQLQTQARLENCDSPYDWKGCLPFNRYKQVCMDRMPYIT